MAILLCYDGSPDSLAAIDLAGELFARRPAIVLTVWEGLSEVLVRVGSGLAAASLNFEEIDADCERAGREQAEEGTERARLAGLEAKPRVAQRHGTVSATILDQAAQVDAEAIVIGSRGLGAVKSLVLGSVSHSLLQHADRPVIVTLATDAAAKRAARRHSGETTAAPGR
jgi:nucleotide-binding universal stress UspA family protein